MAFWCINSYMTVQGQNVLFDSGLFTSVPDVCVNFQRSSFVGGLLLLLCCVTAHTMGGGRNAAVTDVKQW